MIICSVFEVTQQSLLKQPVWVHLISKVSETVIMVEKCTAAERSNIYLTSA